MMIKKLVVGLALGLTLAAGTASTAEAKAKPVVVTVDKADASTARKVDAAFKKGKAVTLKVRGSKKASKALLIDLQKKTAETMRYSVHFDLDDGNRDCEGKGNKFHTYKDLDYKQSGSYGCYTFSKSTCNAYKYAFKFIKGNVDRQMKSVKKAYADYKSSFEGKHSNDNSEFISYMVDFGNSAFAELNIPWDDASADFFTDFPSIYLSEKTGQAPSGSVDKLVAEALSNGANNSFVEALVAEADSYDLSLITAEPMSIDEFIKERYGDDTLKFYKGGALEVDFSWVDTLTVNAAYVGSGMKYGGLWGEFELDSSRKMKAYEMYNGTDEFRLKSLVNDIGHGVCADFAYASRTVVDYLGQVSYYVVNHSVSHAVCAVPYRGMMLVYDNAVPCNVYTKFNVSESGIRDFISGLDYLSDSQKECMYDEDYAYGIKYTFDTSGWEKCFKDAMGADYPF